MSTEKTVTKTKKVVLETPVEKYVDVAKLTLTDGKTINLGSLEIALTSIKLDSEKANKGNKAAGRRFRLNTTALSKHFLEMRKATPRAKLAKKA